jgi:predicted aspartyl protease
MQRWAMTLSVAIFAVCQAMPRTASAADNSKEVAFKLYRDYAVIVHGSVGNLKDLNFLVDTGAVPTVLDKRIASRLHLDTHEGELSVLTKKLSAQRAIAPKVRIGPLQVNNLSVVVHDLSFAEQALGTRVDAMIGFDLLGESPFTIDYRRRKITFGPVDPSFAAISYRPGLPYVIVDLQIQQEKIAIVVDTGASDLVLFESGIRECRAAISTMHERTWSNMGGDVRVREAQLANAHLGNMPWGVRPVFVLANNGESISGVAGVLGTVALKAERVGFDPVRKVLAWEQTGDQSLPRTEVVSNPVDQERSNLLAVTRTPDFSTVTPISNINQLVTIREYNDAQLPETILSQAQNEAVRVFHRAGITVSLVECGTETGDPDSSPCRHPPGPANLVLRIVPRARPSGDSVFGIAFLSAEGTGAYSDVFYDSVEKLHTDWGASIPGVLGHVMAHEIGHLLLGSNAHSRSGIMSPKWHGEQLRGVAMGTLLFTPEQASAMRNRLFAAQHDSALSQ